MRNIILYLKAAWWNKALGLSYITFPISLIYMIIFIRALVNHKFTTFNMDGMWSAIWIAVTAMLVVASICTIGLCAFGSHTIRIYKDATYTFRGGIGFYSLNAYKSHYCGRCGLKWAEYEHKHKKHDY